MGQRATLVIVEGGQHRLFYNHWCANRLPDDLFWGPEHALRFIQSQQEVDGWLDEVWAEGAAVLDLDQRTLLFYGGEDVMYDVPLRRVHLELMRQVWQSWDVRWAGEGIAAIAEYVGYPKDSVLRTEVVMDRPQQIAWSPPRQWDWTRTVASIRLVVDQMLFLPLPDFPDDVLFSGPALLDAAGTGGGFERLPLDEWMTTLPRGGFHVDLPSRTLEFWVARPAPDIQARVASRWPGWTVRWRQDAFEFQLDRTGGLLRFAVPSRTSLEESVMGMLLHETARSGADIVRDTIAALRAEGKNVEVNPWALHDNTVEVPLNIRRMILARALNSGAET
jgi:hypothetical protein